MKLETRNFTGVLPTGYKYRIQNQTKFNEFAGDYTLTVFVEEFILDGWFVNADMRFEADYSSAKDYKKALRSCLIKLEEVLGKQLLKGELKIAA